MNTELKTSITLFSTAMKPGQTIAQSRLISLLGIKKKYQFYSHKRLLQLHGYLTEKIEHKVTMYTFHKPPLKSKERQAPITRNRNDAPPANGLFKVEKTFTLSAGTYTASQLKSLAVAVLKELDYHVD